MTNKKAGGIILEIEKKYKRTGLLSKHNCREAAWATLNLTDLKKTKSLMDIDIVGNTRLKKIVLMTEWEYLTLGREQQIDIEVRLVNHYNYG